MKTAPTILSRSLAALVLTAGIVTAAAWAAQPAQPAEQSQAKPAPSPATNPAPSPAISPATKPVNKLCPIMESEVDAEAPTRQFKGVTIGFCCPGCDRKWDRTSDAGKLAMLTKLAPEAITAINAASNPALKVARDYLAACAKSDLTALNALFLDKGRATVSENASDEGTWETYRDQHLMPELKAMPGFVMSITKEDVQTFAATSIVRQMGSFTMPDPNQKELTKTYLAAITYVVVDDGGTPKIAHMHRSSRAEKQTAAGAPAMHDHK